MIHPKGSGSVFFPHKLNARLLRRGDVVLLFDGSFAFGRQKCNGDFAGLDSVEPFLNFRISSMFSARSNNLKLVGGFNPVEKYQ